MGEERACDRWTLPIKADFGGEEGKVSVMGVWDSGPIEAQAM